MRVRFRNGGASVVTGLSMALAACSEHSVEPRNTERAAAVEVQADVGASVITAVVVEVAGPGIAVPIVANLSLSNGVASGRVEVLAGSARVFTLHAFNDRSIETHRGMRTVDVAPDQNTNLAISLTPLTGGAVIDARLGTFTISISPANAHALVGQSLPFTATVTGAEGAPVPEAEVGWATANPGLVAIDAAGVARALNAGTTIVVATHRGFAGATSITVTP